MRFFRITFLLFFVMVALCGSPVRAITVISPIVEVTVDPGTSQQGVVKVYNETDHELKLTAHIEAMRDSDENRAITSDNERPTFLSWIALERTSLTLESHQAAIVPLTVQVPKSAAPGGYYAVVFWQEVPPGNNEQKNVSINGRVGTLVFLTVTGDITEQAAIASFTVEASQPAVFKVPLTFSALVANHGNIHVQPTGKITLTNWLGQKTELQINAEHRSVLPGSTRRFEVLWPSMPSEKSWWKQQWLKLVTEANYLAIGPYRATLTMEYGVSEPHFISAETSIIIVPVHLIGAAIALLALAGIGWRINRRITKLKQSARNI